MTIHHAPKKPTFTMTKVDSSSLASHGYDPATKTLAVEFKNGSRYWYHDVPQSVATALASSSSAGGYFAASVRNAFKGTKQ